MKTKTWVVLLLSLALLVPAGTALAAPDDLKYITLDTLKGRLGAPDLLIIDVRAPGDWDRSATKIPGAVRQDPKKIETWGPNLPRDKQIVLYCA